MKEIAKRGKEKKMSENMNDFHISQDNIYFGIKINFNKTLFSKANQRSECVTLHSINDSKSFVCES